MLELQTPQDAAHWLRSRVTGTIRTDSRKLQPGDGFIAWPGAAVDARQHVAGALARGATACLVELDGAERFAFSGDNVAAYTAALRNAIEAARRNGVRVSVDIVPVESVQR